MSREKKIQFLKLKKILIRLKPEDKKLADELAYQAGMNTSEYIRFLLNEKINCKKLYINSLIIEQQKKMMTEIKHTILEGSNEN